MLLPPPQHGTIDTAGASRRLHTPPSLPFCASFRSLIMPRRAALCSPPPNTRTPQQVALDAAEKGDQHALYIKLSNNMGAVLRKQEQHAEVRLAAHSACVHVHVCMCMCACALPLCACASG